MTLSLTLHLTKGSHLPTSYLVQRANSNNDNEYKIIISNANSEEEASTVTISSTAANTDDNTPTTPSSTLPETSSTPSTDVTSDSELGFNNSSSSETETEQLPSSELSDASTTISQDQAPKSTQEPAGSDNETTTTTTTTSSILAEKESLLTNSYEDNIDSHSNYISEHDHYDEYTAMKVALEKGRSSSEETKSRKTSREVGTKPERRPYYLQTGDGRKYACM